jgi:hypothetical protein
MTPFWMCKKWSIFFLISSTLLYVTLSSVKEFKKTMTSSLAGNDRRIMVRSSSKLFWNGVSDRIICFLVQSSARAFRISLFGRPLLKFVPKGELFYQELRSKTTLMGAFLINLDPRPLDDPRPLSDPRPSTLVRDPRPLGDPRPSTQVPDPRPPQVKYV